MCCFGSCGAAPMERFEEAVFLVAHTMGFQHLGFTKINEGAKRDLWSQWRGNLTAEDVHRMETYGQGWVPAEDAQLVAAVNTHASVDVRMYAQAVGQFDAQLASLEADVQAEMREYVSLPDIKGWHGDRCVCCVTGAQRHARAFTQRGPMCLPVCLPGRRRSTRGSCP